MEDYSITGLIVKLENELSKCKRWIKTLKRLEQENRLSVEGEVMLSKNEFTALQIENTLKALKGIK